MTATATGDDGSGIVGSGAGVSISGGEVTAIGPNCGISGTVKNAIPGTGWTDVDGTQGKASIAVNTDPGQQLNSYKRVRFPAAGRVSIYRMYNTETSEHLYTTNKAEYDSCGKGAYADWNAEGVAWLAL